FMGKPSDLHDVDHINGNRADNRLCNLRWANRTQNNGNSRAGRGASQYRGVVKGQSGRWAAQIGKKGKHVFLGEYTTQEEAARAYDREAKQYFGAFARLNFPDIATEGVAP
ncbi:MAG: AP2/ERF family transcription factor, partial [Roseovarius sp.]|nr:AP2/ERF family transcription factor [Roseovarius sp.]